MDWEWSKQQSYIARNGLEIILPPAGVSVRKISAVGLPGLLLSGLRLTSLILMLMTLFPLALPERSATAKIDDNLYSLSLSTTPTIDMSLEPVSSKTMAIKKHTVSATTASPAGFKLYLSSNSNDANAYRGGTTTIDPDKIIAPTTATYTDPAALTIPSPTALGTWGYALASVENFDASYSETAPDTNAKFAGLPLLGSEQLIHTHSGTADSKPIDVYYGVKADFDIALGEYITVVRYASVTEISDQPSGEATNTPAYLPVSYPTDSRITITTSLRTSLSLGEITATVGGQPCTDVQLVPDTSSVTFSCQVPSGLILNQSYDINVSIPKFARSYSIPDGVTVLSKLQDFTPATCINLNIGDQHQYVDTRDYKAYYISRLKMNREGTQTACWMTQNLDLDLDSTKTYTPDDTDIPANWQPSQSTIAVSSSTATGWVHNNNYPSSADSGDTYIYSRGNSSRNYYSLSECAAAGVSKENCLHAHIGNHYNWSAAVAMNDTSGYTTALSSIDQSICPKGWRLPTSRSRSNSSGEYARLIYANGVVDTLATGDPVMDYASSGFNSLRDTPLFVVRGGFVNSNGRSYTGVYGYHWTSTINSSAQSQYFYVIPSFIRPHASNYRSSGLSVRCMAHLPEYSLSFDANGGIDAPGTMSQESLESATFTLPTDEFPEHDTRQFYGWDEDPNATIPDYIYDHATQTFSQETFTLTAPNTSGTLYAIWHQPVGMGTVETLQEVTPALCQTSPLNQQYRLKDARDDKMYYIARLKMNREGTETACWMTQNLDLNLSSSASALTSINTDIDSDWTPQNNTISFTGTSLTGWTNSYTNPYSADPGDVYYYTSGSNSSDTIYDDLSACVNAGNKIASCRRSHAGNYYNFTAAVAMDDSSSYTTKYQTVDQSICPSGWKIPTGMPAVGVAGEINHLFYANNITDTLATQTDQNVGYATDGFNNIRTSPLWLLRSGRIYSASLQYPGIYGYYMSSSVFSPAHNYYLNFGSGYLGSTYYNNRAYGYSVRCTLRGNNYTLEFDANGGSNAPSSINKEVSESSVDITLPSTVPNVPGHDAITFRGWATSPTATDPDYSYNGSTFSPSAITLDIAFPDVTLYAIWSEERDMSDITNLQEINPIICRNSTLEQQYLLTDSRDTKDYYVARFNMKRDGSESACWMTQNLDLDLDADTTYTSADTDVLADWKPPRSTIHFSGTSVPDWVEDNNTPYSADPGESYFVSSGSGVNDVNYTSLTDCTGAGYSIEDCRHSHVGNYYNWPAAIATNDASIYATPYQNTNQSICPKGWRLPTSRNNSTTTGELNFLFYANNITNTLSITNNYNFVYTVDGFKNIRISPLWFLRGGYIASSSSSLSSMGQSGYYWSSSTYTDANSYRLIFNTGLYPTYYGARHFGFNIRCVAR